MEPIKDLHSGDPITPEWLASLARGIQELQRKAIQGAQWPLTISVDGWLSSAMVATTFRAKIIAHTGTGPLNWGPYTLQRWSGGSSGSWSGATLSAWNGAEDDGVANDIISGAPGSLGITIDASGNTSSGSCVVKPLGGMVVDVSRSESGLRWEFTEPNYVEPA